MSRNFRITEILLLGAVTQIGIAQQGPGPCRDAEQYSPPVASLHAEVPPLMVNRVFGRAIIEAGETVITGDKVTPACISLFTDDSHRFVASVAVDSRGLFRFRSIPPGRYRFVARSPGLCTGNTQIEVTTSSVDKAKNGILVHFRIREIDSCSYADYETKTARSDRGIARTVNYSACSLPPLLPGNKLGSGGEGVGETEKPAIFPGFRTGDRLQGTGGRNHADQSSRNH